MGPWTLGRRGRVRLAPDLLGALISASRKGGTSRFSDKDLVASLAGDDQLALLLELLGPPHDALLGGLDVPQPHRTHGLQVLLDDHAGALRDVVEDLVL